jgi:amidase
LFGHKPTWGIVPQRGHIPGLPGSRVDADLNVIGPLARGADDLALALGVLAGPGPRTARGWRLELPAPRRKSLSEFRVAAWLDDPTCRVDPEVGDCLARTVEGLRKAGVKVDDRARPECGLDAMLRVYLRLLAPITSNTMDEDQFRNLERSLRAAGPPGDGPYDGLLHDIAITHRDWLVTHEERLRMQEQWDGFFENFDVLLCPVLPMPAIEHQNETPLAERSLTIAGSKRSYLEHFAWMGPIGAVGLPASVAPAGRTPGGLPVGVQIVGPQLGDRTTIAFAAALAEECGGFEPPPLCAGNEGASRAKVR